MVGLEGLDLGRRCPSIVATQSLLAVGKKRHFGASLGDVSATGPARAFRATLGAGALLGASRQDEGEWATGAARAVGASALARAEPLRRSLFARAAKTSSGRAGAARSSWGWPGSAGCALWICGVLPLHKTEPPLLTRGGGGGRCTPLLC